MSINAFGQAGFGIGAIYGVPVTVACDSTTTTNITGTAYATRQYYLANNTAAALTGVTVQMVSTSNGVTATMTLFAASGGHFYNDNSSVRIVNSTTSVQIVLIPS